MKKLLSLLLPACLLMSACSVTGPAEDQWDADRKEDEKLDLGFIRKKSNNKQEDDKGRTYYPSATYSTKDLTIDEESFKDFEEFKAWRRAQEEGSVDSQEYRDWVEYQKYRQYKSQSESQAK